MLSKGEIIAALVALGFEGDVGPMGAEDPKLKGRDVIFFSQCPDAGYHFNDDGSVQVFYPDKNATFNSLVHDCGYTEEDAQEEIDNPPHYKNVMDLFESDDGWFLYFIYDSPHLVIAIQEVLKHENSKD